MLSDYIELDEDSKSDLEDVKYSLIEYGETEDDYTTCKPKGEHLYWNRKGKFQKEYNKLWKEVPNLGESKESYLEALRIISKHYCDLFNNGYGNIKVISKHSPLSHVGLIGVKTPETVGDFVKDPDALVDLVIETIIKRRATVLG